MYEQSGDEYIAKEQGSNILDQNMNQTLGVTMNARLNYKRTFNEVHNLNVFVAYEQDQSRYDYMQARRQDFISTAIDEIFAGDINSANNDGKASETDTNELFWSFGTMIMLVNICSSSTGDMMALRISLQVSVSVSSLEFL